MREGTFRKPRQPAPKPSKAQPGIWTKPAKGRKLAGAPPMPALAPHPQRDAILGEKHETSS
ncbi:MAG: hypothetical protein KIT83_02120 [Bryobacterales bacterium]|nr:hypothetical protein [Bryobacterales bacterium]